MAITALPASAVSQEPSARPSALTASTQREHKPKPIDQASAIAHISLEGKQRAALDLQQAATPTVTAGENLQGRANALPQRRTAAEEAHDAAAAAVLAARAPAPALPARELSKADEAGASVSSSSSTRSQQQAISSAASPVHLGAPAHVADRPASVQPDQLPRENSNTASVPVPVKETSRAVDQSNQNAAITPEAVAIAAAGASKDKVESPRVSQNAKDFAAAFNAPQVKRNPSQETAAPQQQTVKTSALQNVASSTTDKGNAGVESSARRAEQDSVRSNTTNFAAGVVRNNVAQVQRQNQGDTLAAVTRSDAGNVVRNVHSTETRGEQSRAPTAPVGSVNAAPQSSSQAASKASAATQLAQNAQQINTAPAQAGGASAEQAGLSKHLNALANLLTP